MSKHQLVLDKCLLCVMQICIFPVTSRIISRKSEGTLYPCGLVVGHHNIPATKVLPFGSLSLPFQDIFLSL